MGTSAVRVASRYRAAQDESVVMDEIIDLWVDAAMDALAGVHLTERDVEAALHAAGVTADQVNEAAESTGRTASSGLDYVTALGGKVLHWAWDTVTHPFIAAWKLLTTAQARQRLKQWLKRVVRKEVAETRHMWVVAKFVARGQTPEKADLTKAVHQFGDLLKTAILAGVLAHHFGPELVHDPGHILMMLASPADEMVGIMLDHPLQIATRTLLGKAFGLLPTAFYEVV